MIVDHSDVRWQQDKYIIICTVTNEGKKLLLNHVHTSLPRLSSWEEKKPLCLLVAAAVQCHVSF